MDDFMNAVKTCFNKYTEFKGRAARPEFWWFALFYAIVMIVAGMFGMLLQGLVWLGIVLPMLAVGTRRLHDMGKSGWFQLLWLLPVIGWGILIYWLAQPTVPANEYGGVEISPDAPTIMPGPQ
jgi:uncharacterized membrane protein YhaH (DUF805 family)